MLCIIGNNTHIGASLTNDWNTERSSVEFGRLFDGTGRGRQVSSSFTWYLLIPTSVKTSSCFSIFFVIFFPSLKLSSIFFCYVFLDLCCLYLDVDDNEHRLRLGLLLTHGGIGRAVKLCLSSFPISEEILSNRADSPSTKLRHVWEMFSCF